MVKDKQRNLRSAGLMAFFFFVVVGQLVCQEDLKYRRLKSLVESQASNTSAKSVREFTQQVQRFAKIDLRNFPKAQRDCERFLLFLIRKFSNDKSYAFRKTATVTLGHVLGTAEGVDDLFRFVRSSSGKRDMRQSWAILALSHLRGPKALDRLCRYGLNHRSKKVRLLVCQALAELKDETMCIRAAHYREPIEALFGDQNSEVVAAAVLAAGNLNLMVMDAFDGIRHHKDSLVRRSVAVSLGQLHMRPHARDAMAELLVDNNLRVREEAARSLGRCGDVEVCGDLIPRLRLEGRRNRHAIFKSLRRLTRLELSESIGAWESWWLVAKEKLKTGRSLGLPGAEEEVIPGGRGRYDAHYYGVPIHSDRVLFIVDISQSMRFGGVMDDPDRLDLAKAELTRAIDTLKPDMRFNILVFSTGNAMMKTGKLMAATARNRRRAKKWVRRLVAAGGTNTYGALKAAFQKQKEIDTVFLLSDGEPSRGGITAPEALLAWIREQNLRRALIINTVAIVKWHPLLISFDPSSQADAAARFMEEVALITKGKFVRLD